MKKHLFRHIAVACAAAFLTQFPAQAQIEELVASYRSVPDLVAWYKLNQKGDFVTNKVDLSAGTVYGASWAKGYLGNGRSFDGIDDWVGCGNVLDLAGGDFTIAVWVYPRSNDFGMIANKGAYYHVVGSYYLAITTEGVRFVISDGADPGWAGIEGNNAPLALNTWQHVAATFHRTGSGSELTVYVNGEVLDAAFTPRDCQHSSADFEFGAYFHPWYGHTFGNYNGVMDELLVFNRSLSQAEIQHVAGPIRN